MSFQRQDMIDMVHAVQDDITQAMTEIDPVGFKQDAWERPGGGGGRTRVLQDGKVFEKAGVGVSVVMGELSPEAAASMGGGQHIEDPSFFACGVSLVIHPHNPMAPTVHANFRYFERGDGSAPGSWWFGGGADLTPSYLFEDDVRHFHEVWKETCDEHDPAFYQKYKAWCDEYFYIPHRKEGRGVGGIFYDNLNDRSKDACFAFTKDCANSFLHAYLPIILGRKDAPFEPHHKDWQQVRRGRYVEFNLVYDRGTKFGLKTDGRIESILMSLPLTASWMYDHHPREGSKEAQMLDVLQHPRNWA